MKDYIFTSESITEGHPDKICDKIADSILDEALRQDPYSNMAVEATIKDDFVLIYGEADTKAHIDYAQIAKDVIRKIGYEEEYTVMIRVNKQSSEIHHAVNHADHVIGAGDQGIMFGYACNESDEYMPAPIYYAHKLARQLTKVRRENPLLKPDGKTQVSVEYKDGKIARIDTIVVSTQHSAQASQEQIREIVMNEVIRPCIEAELIDERTRFLINPSGSFVVGGSFGDSGTTGRKIVCDTYGGMGRIGGGCFSSKDPTKVDRSAAYYCRYVAKNIVANGLAERCEVQVAYAIGKAIENGTVLDLLNFFKVKKGDHYFIESGTVHAIGKGCLIAEIQQNSNLTYRVYDYGRKDKNGKGRELHVEKAKKVANLSAFHNAPLNEDYNGGKLIGECKYFKVAKYSIGGEKKFVADEKSFKAVSVLSGEGKVGDWAAKRGDTFFVPASYGEFIVTGNMEIIVSEV